MIRELIHDKKNQNRKKPSIYNLKSSKKLHKKKHTIPKTNKANPASSNNPIVGFVTSKKIKNLRNYNNNNNSNPPKNERAS